MLTTVLLVDDATELLPVIRQSIRLTSDFDVVAEATDGASAIDAARTHQPNLVVLDLGLPDLTGHEVLTGIREAAPEAQVVIFSGAHTEDRVEVANRAEAYVGKELEIGELVKQLIEVSQRRHLSAQLRLTPRTTSAAVARQFLDELCTQWECTELLPEARLIASELVTNAVIHAASECEVRVTLDDEALRIEVIDHGHKTKPELLHPTADETHGRGLLLVSVLSKAWGTESLRGTGNLVWSVLPAVV